MIKCEGRSCWLLLPNRKYRIGIMHHGRHGARRCRYRYKMQFHCAPFRSAAPSACAGEEDAYAGAEAGSGVLLLPLAPAMAPQALWSSPCAWSACPGSRTRTSPTAAAPGRTPRSGSRRRARQPRARPAVAVTAAGAHEIVVVHDGPDAGLVGLECIWRQRAMFSSYRRSRDRS